MARRDVEGFEVVPLRLHLWALLDLVPKALQHGLDLAARLGQDVDVAPLERRARKRDVDRLRLGDVREARALELFAARCESRFDRTLGVVRGLPEGGALGGFEVGYAGQQLADVPTFAAVVLDRDRLELLGGLRFCNRGKRHCGERGGIAHAASLLRISKRISAAAAATLSDSTPSLR